MTRSRSLISCLCVLATCAAWGSAVRAQDAPRVTVISDAFSDRHDLELDWGFSALIEYQGRRILFDTGNNSTSFAGNARALGVDLTRLDFVVISHRHGDHTDGLRHLLAVNPGVQVYAPADEYFGGSTPAAFFQRAVPSLPSHMRYFGGAVPGVIPHGSPWRSNTRLVADTLRLAPGIRLVSNRADRGPFTETPELSLVLDSPDGPVVFVGCSHPGIERILASIGARAGPIAAIVGGLHLVTTPDSTVAALVGRLRQQWRVRAVAPGHCTGEHAFAALQQAYGRRYIYAGVGSRFELRELAD